MLTGNLYSVTVIYVQVDTSVGMSCRIVYKEGKNLTVGHVFTPNPSHPSHSPPTLLISEP